MKSVTITLENPEPLHYCRKLLGSPDYVCPPLKRGDECYGDCMDCKSRDIELFQRAKRAHKVEAELDTKQSEVITEEMRKAGNDIAAHLMDAGIAKCLGGLGGNKGWDEWVKNFTGKNLDLIKQYVDEEIDSVTAIYIAMERERK